MTSYSDTGDGGDYAMSITPSNSRSEALCSNCGKTEVSHLRGDAASENGEPCTGYRPRGGVTRKIMRDMMRATARSAGKRIIRIRKP